MTEDNLILPGWALVTEGRAQVFDKYWSPRHGAWLPVTANSGRDVKFYAAVIRRN